MAVSAWGLGCPGLAEQEGVGTAAPEGSLALGGRRSPRTRWHSWVNPVVGDGGGAQEQLPSHRAQGKVAPGLGEGLDLKLGRQFMCHCHIPGSRKHKRLLDLQQKPDLEHFGAALRREGLPSARGLLSRPVTGAQGRGGFWVCFYPVKAME